MNILNIIIMFTFARIQNYFMNKELSEFNRLLEIMDELRAKCPWDKKQTKSLRRCQ